MIPINIFVEDDLSEYVVKRVLSTRPIKYYTRVFCNGGFGYLKKIAPKLNNTAKGCPHLLLTDLDKYSCPPFLLQNWFRKKKLNDNFIFRIAVHEVESWLLSDISGLCRFFQLRNITLRKKPDAIKNPKIEIFRMADKSHIRQRRDAIVYRNDNGTLCQGPDYNGELGLFVQKYWDIISAINNSHSLNRFVNSLQRLEKTGSYDYPI